MSLKKRITKALSRLLERITGRNRGTTRVEGEVKVSTAGRTRAPPPPLPTRKLLRGKQFEVKRTEKTRTYVRMTSLPKYVPRVGIPCRTCYNCRCTCEKSCTACMDCTCNKFFLLKKEERRIIIV